LLAEKEIALLKKVAEYIESNIKRSLVEIDGVASGKLLSSIQSEVNKVKGDILGYAEDYAKYKDQGRPAGKMPPIFAIERWIQEKGLSATLNPFAVAKSIGKFGVKPKKRFVTDTLNELNTTIEKKLFETFGVIIDNKIQNIIKDGNNNSN